MKTKTKTSAFKVPLIVGSNDRKLYGLCTEFIKKSNQWMIEDASESYSNMINAYQSDSNPESRAKKLKDLTWLSEFNESQYCNVISETLSESIKPKDMYAQEYKNRADALNNRIDIDVEEVISSSINPENALIDYIDNKNNKKKKR